MITLSVCSDNAKKKGLKGTYCCERKEEGMNRKEEPKEDEEGKKIRRDTENRENTFCHIYKPSDILSVH